MVWLGFGPKSLFIAELWLLLIAESQLRDIYPVRPSTESQEYTRNYKPELGQLELENSCRNIHIRCFRSVMELLSLLVPFEPDARAFGCLKAAIQEAAGNSNAYQKAANC